MFWKLEEARLLQYRTATSAANAENLNIGGGVPAGKCWVVTAFSYLPSVVETQTVSIVKITTAGYYFPLLNPLSMALGTHLATFIEQGTECLLFPGEYIQVIRGSHTAGSTMSAFMQLIEIDLPLYTYEEPQLVARQKRALSSIRTALSRGGGRGGSMVGAAGAGPISHGGGGGTTIPV